MLATSLSTDAWLGTALIAAITVLSCLGFLCTRLRYELELIDVVSSVKSLRDKIARQLDEAGAEAANQPSRVERIAGSAGSSTPTPDSEDSADWDGPADTQENSEVQAEPEVVGPDSAEAA